MRLALTTAALCVALASAPAYAEKRTMTVAKFDKVAVAALVEVELRQGGQSITAEESAGNFDDLKLEVRNGTLYVGRQNSDRNSGKHGHTDYRLTITAPDFKAISAAAASEVTSDHLSLKDVEVRVSSASIIDLKGVCTTLTITASSGAQFDGGGLRCKSAHAKATTGAIADLWVSGEASGEASTGGTITFAGKPKSLARKSTLGGTITVD
jgi:putative autotransporter adhesin-like protein